MKKVLSKSKMVYSITDKFSGQPSGYAFMLSDSFVSLNQVQLLPWQAPHSSGDIQPDREGESESRSLAPGSLASDLDISEDSSVNSTVEDGLSVTGETRKVEEILDMCSSSRINTTDNDFTEASQTDVDVTKLSANNNNNWNSAPLVFNSGKSVVQTFAAEIAAKLVGEKRADSKNSVMDEESFGSTKSSRESPVKRKPGVQSSVAAFYSDVGFTQPEGKKVKFVRCLLCKKENVVSIKNFRRHVRAIHEPHVECDICGGKYSSERMSVHRKICFGGSFKTQEMRAQESRLSETQLKSENEEVKFKFQEMRAQAPRLSEKQLKSENEEVKFKLISAVKPEIGIKEEECQDYESHEDVRRKV